MFFCSTNDNENQIKFSCGYLQRSNSIYGRTTRCLLNNIFEEKLTRDGIFPFPSKIDVLEKKFINEIETMKFLICSDYRSYAVNYRSIENRVETSASIFSSEHIRNNGNKALKNQKFIDAADMYAGAAYTANKYTLNYSFAYSNRSIVLMKMGHYSEAFDDCEIAKKSFYPIQKLNKLLDRQAQCAMEIESYSKLNMIIEEIEHLEKYFGKKSEKLNSYKAALQKFHIDNTNELVQNSHPINDKKKTMNGNIKKHGENVTSAKSIKKDETIFVDKALYFSPISAMLVNQKCLPCSNCANRTAFPFGCENCKMTIYCNLKCLNEDFHIHKFECKGYSAFIGYFPEISLSLRTFLIIWPEIKSFLLNMGIKNSNSNTVFNKLIANVGQFKFNHIIKNNMLRTSSSEFVARCGLVAITIITYLKIETTFFENISEDLREIMKMDIDWEILFSSIFMRIYSHVLKTNTVVYTMVKNLFNLTILNLNKFFVIRPYILAIFPQISQLKHSCDPNIIFRFDNNQANVCAIKDIPKDTEILTCYGPHYKLMSRFSRHKILQESQCECNCEKCQKKVEDFNYFICRKHNCSAKIFTQENIFIDLMSKSNIIISCTKCGNNFELNWMRQIHKILLEPGKNTKQLLVCLEYYDKSSANMSKFHKSKERMANAIIATFIDIAFIDNFKIHAKYTELLLEYMEICKEIYGELSLEYVNACLYLLDIMAFRKLKNFPKIPDGLKMIEIYSKVVQNDIKEYIDNYIKNYIASQ